MRELYSTISEEERKGAASDLALRVAAGGIVDLLFYSYGMMLFALAIIGFLLTRIDGVK
jgi:hypothetical protein